MLGSFVKILEVKEERYTSYVRICVYMNVVGALLESITIRFQEVDWVQMLDYEHIPFQYHKCHEHGHLFRDCPQNVGSSTNKSKETIDDEGFTKVPSKRKSGRKDNNPTPNPKLPIKINFKVLANAKEDPTKEGESLKNGQHEIKDFSPNLGGQEA
jgi:hypothetical protein